MCILYLLGPNCQSSPTLTFEQKTHNRQARKTAKIARSVSSFKCVNGSPDIVLYPIDLLDKCSIVNDFVTALENMQ